MRYREIDPLKRVAGLLWAAFSLLAAGIGVWAAWNGTHGSDLPDPSSELQHDNAKQIWIWLVFVVMGGLSTAFGVALAFEREPKRKWWWIGPRQRGLVPNAKAMLFFLTFFVCGLILLSGMLVPGVYRWSVGGIILASCFLISGAGGLWVIFKKRRKRRERSLEAARKVAEARERRLAARRKRS